LFSVWYYSNHDRACALVWVTSYSGAYRGDQETQCPGRWITGGAEKSRQCRKSFFNRVRLLPGGTKPRLSDENFNRKPNRGQKRAKPIINPDYKPNFVCDIASPLSQRSI